MYLTKECTQISKEFLLKICRKLSASPIGEMRKRHEQALHKRACTNEKLIYKKIHNLIKVSSESKLKQCSNATCLQNG